MVPGPPMDNKIWACSRHPWYNWPSISSGSISVGSASMDVRVPLYHLPSSKAAIGSESEHTTWFRGWPTTCTLQHESYLSVAPDEKTTEDSPFALCYFALLSLGVEGEYKEVLWLRKTFLLNDTGSLDIWWHEMSFARVKRHGYWWDPSLLLVSYSPFALCFLVNFGEHCSNYYRQSEYCSNYYNQHAFCLWWALGLCVWSLLDSVSYLFSSWTEILNTGLFITWFREDSWPDVMVMEVGEVCTVGSWGRFLICRRQRSGELDI